VATFRRWAEATPAEFRFAIKANRHLTHSEKLNDPVPAIRLERGRADHLGVRLAARRKRRLRVLRQRRLRPRAA
jgi:uncharacterized protein YecE (DUF72 family)